LPWEYLYYMATVPLQRSEEQFWEMSLRVLVAMIRQHEKTERNKAKAVGYMTACFMNGQNPDGETETMTSKQLRKKELEMGNAMW
jgi:hypothetical protein